MPELIVRIIGDTTALERSYRKAEKDTRTFGVRMQGLSRTALRGGGVATFGYLAYQYSKEGVKAASNLSEQISKTNIVFGRSAAQVKAWSQTSAQSMGLARDEALQLASSFGALLQPLGITGDEAARQSEQLTQLGADLASFYNTDVKSALDAVRSGLVGESEPLRRYGVLLSEARVKQEAMRETGKTNADQLTETDKVLARIRLTFKDSQKAQGNFAETSKDSANQMRILQANSRDLAATLAGPLVDGLTLAARGVNALFEEFKRGNTLDFKTAVELLERGVYAGARSYRALDAIESMRGSRDLGTIYGGVTGAATAGRRPSAAAIRAWNRQTMQRNQWFDTRVGRMLGRVQDISSLRGQISQLGVIAEMIRKRIAVTKDVTRLHGLEDTLADVLRQQRGTKATLADELAARAEAAKLAAEQARQAARDEKFGWLDFAIERAETTKTLKDDRTALRNKERYIEALIKSEGRTLELTRELWRVRQQQRDLNKAKAADGDPLAGLMQVSSKRMAGILAAGVGVTNMGRLQANIAAQEITVYSVLDGQVVARSVNRANARTAHRTARQTSGLRGG